MDGNITDKVVLNAHTHDNVLNMLNSVDDENKVVALSCVENVDFNTNLVYILILRKQGKASTAQWKEHAPNTAKMLSSIGINMDSSLTWKNMMETLIKRKCPPEDIQFYLDRFAVYLYEEIKGLGYEFIDTVEINLKLKTKDGEQIATVTKDIKSD